MNLIVDLNADLGEGSGHDEELFELISSANVATGFHAGDSDIDARSSFCAQQSTESPSERIQVFSIAKISDARN